MTQRWMVESLRGGKTTETSTNLLSDVVPKVASPNAKTWLLDLPVEGRTGGEGAEDARGFGGSGRPEGARFQNAHAETVEGESTQAERAQIARTAMGVRGSGLASGGRADDRLQRPLSPTPAATSVSTPPPAPIPPASPVQAFEELRARAEEAGLEAAKSRVDAVEQAYFEAIADLVAARKSIVASYERHVVELAMMVAREVLQRELTVDGDGMCTRLEQALHEGEGERGGMVVRIGTADMDHIRRCRPDLLVRGTEFVVDESLPSGSCVVEERERVIDVSIERSLEGVRRALLDVGLFGSLDATQATLPVLDEEASYES